MGPLDALWHFLNFLYPAASVGLIAAGAAKLLWRKELRSVPWLRLGAEAAAAGAVVLVAGLAWYGRDGKMATYLLLVAAVALTLWLRGWVRPAR